MLLKDIKPNTEYADCNGNLIVTGDNVENLYHWYPGNSRKANELHSSSVKPLHPDLKENEKLLALLDKQQEGKPAKKKDVGKPDPWDRCTTKGRRSQRRAVIEGAYGYKFWSYGILVEQYHHDRNGKRGELLGTDVVTPKNIPGTWADYVTLHADEMMLPFVQADVGNKAKDLQRTAWYRAIMAGLNPVTDSNLTYQSRTVGKNIDEDLRAFDGINVEMLPMIAAPSEYVDIPGMHWFSVWGRTAKADPKRTVIVPKVTLTGTAAQEYLENLNIYGDPPTNAEIDKMPLTEVRKLLKVYGARLPSDLSGRGVKRARGYLQRVASNPVNYRGIWKGRK